MTADPAAVAYPAASFSPLSLNFGIQPLRSSSNAESVTLSNAGNAVLRIVSIGVSGTASSEFVQTNNCGNSVAAGSNCTISVIFAPSAGGLRAATITVTDNLSSSPQTVALTGTGGTSASAGVLSPTSVTFGNQPVGTTSTALYITLTNLGNSALNISSLGVTDGNAADFAETNNCSNAVSAGANCTIRITFTPSATGPRLASLSVADNVGGSAQAVGLTGVGTSPGSDQTVNVDPSDDLQTIVNEYPGSTTFSLAPGVYRLQSMVPRTGDSFIGQTGAILNGSALLTTFTQSGSYWTAEAEVMAASSYRGTCNSASPACAYPEDLFFDNVPKTRVTSLASVGPGSWYLDYSNGTVSMGDDPTGHTVEISVLPHAFSGGAQSVTISNLVIEKYACQAGSGAVDGESGSFSWTVGNNEIRYNHGMGIGTGNGMYVYNNNVHNNGELGMGGSGSNIQVIGNQFSNNNYAGYSYTWEAGGVKFTFATNLTIENNSSSENNGPGFWIDSNCQEVTLSGNQTTGNNVAGILFEISSGATIANNTISNDGYNPSGSNLFYGAGILISNSSNVTITGNTVTGCMNGIGGILGDRGDDPGGTPYVLENVVAEDNTITQSTGLAMGIVEGSGYDNSVYTTVGNSFQNNTFVLASPSTGLYFYWMGEDMTLATWNSEVN